MAMDGLLDPMPALIERFTGQEGHVERIQDRGSIEQAGGAGAPTDRGEVDDHGDVLVATPGVVNATRTRSRYAGAGGSCPRFQTVPLEQVLRVGRDALP